MRKNITDMLRYGILGIIIAVSLLLSSCENG